MTTATTIITDAYRETNLIPMGTTPTANQITEALPLLNTIILSTIGNEVGDELRDLNLGGSYDESDVCINWIPPNARLVLNLGSPVSYNLDPSPYDGQRLGVIDVAGNIATNTLTLVGNGRTIELQTTLVLNTNSMTRQWMYRADLGQWIKITSLLATDLMPFDVEFDGYFRMMLAMRLNPRAGQALSPETVEALKRAKHDIVARYRFQKEIYPDYMGRLGEKRQGAYNQNAFGRGVLFWR